METWQQRNKANNQLVIRPCLRCAAYGKSYCLSAVARVVYYGFTSAAFPIKDESEFVVAVAIDGAHSLISTFIEWIIHIDDSLGQQAVIEATIPRATWQWWPQRERGRSLASTREPRHPAPAWLYVNILYRSTVCPHNLIKTKTQHRLVRRPLICRTLGWFVDKSFDER